jgi:hypothetical protein
VLGTGAKAVLAVLAGFDQVVQFVDDVVVLIGRMLMRVPA